MLEKLSDDRSEKVPQALDKVGKRKRVTTVFLVAPLIEALEIGHVQWAIRRLADIEGQIGAEGAMAYFAKSEDLGVCVQTVCDLARAEGRKSQAEALERAFEKYFALVGNENPIQE